MGWCEGNLLLGCDQGPGQVGNLWVWGSADRVANTDTGEHRSWTGGRNGAAPNTKDGDKRQASNKPAVVHGLGCIKEVAGSA